MSVEKGSTDLLACPAHMPAREAGMPSRVARIDNQTCATRFVPPTMPGAAECLVFAPTAGSF